MLQQLATFLLAAGTVTLAEMGDKTQLLAMCFATRFQARKVLLGVFIATVLNHAVAVMAGYFLKEFMNAYTTIIQLIASLSFIGFGLWTIRGDEVDKSCDNRNKYGPVITVAIAFFIAEIGDKTQLTTVSLAATLAGPVWVLLGTTAGMLVADGIGIIFGVVMNKKIPEKTLKWVSASIFTLVGFVGYIVTGYNLMNTGILIASTFLIVVLTAGIGYWILKSNPNEGVFDEINAMKQPSNGKEL